MPMRDLALTAAACMLALALSSCGKAERGRCEKMCRNYAELSFRDVEAARLPPEKREAALKEKLEKGLELCIDKCRHANNDSQIDCYTAAKNISELRSCE